MVSATALLGDGGFRERVRKKIREVGGDGESWDVVVPGADRRPDRTAYTVSYVVITNSTKTDHTWLPFFSRLNLMLQARTLENLGVSYTLDRVPIDAAP